jgi:hypothetical protein
MPQQNSPRHQIPFLTVGQAQKELVHNEALTIIDALLFPTVEAQLPAPPSALLAIDAGRCWLVGENATGDWQPRSGHLAYWTGGSWRFVAPVTGMQIWNAATDCQMTRRATFWAASAAITAPNGGGIIDGEARAAIQAILTALEISGVLQTQ